MRTITVLVGPSQRGAPQTVPDERFAELVSERLVVRRFRPDDAVRFAAYRSEPEVARFQSWNAPYGLEQAEAFIAELQSESPDTPGSWFQFAVATRAEGLLIGDCAAVPNLDDPRHVEIGYTIAPEYQRRGYATEAIRRLVGYWFEERTKHRVTATCDSRNLPSARVLERVGFRREGRLVESTWAKGEWTDDLLFAVLEREWAG